MFSKNQNQQFCSLLLAELIWVVCRKICAIIHKFWLQLPKSGVQSVARGPFVALKVILCGPQPKYKNHTNLIVQLSVGGMQLNKSF